MKPTITNCWRGCFGTVVNGTCTNCAKYPTTPYVNMTTSGFDTAGKRTDK